MIVEVRDQGPGVPVPHLERIFDPFFSLKEKGSGLGLSIAANIMQAHGGTIRVENRENGGACFQMIFPTASQPRDRSAEEGQREESAHASR
jgi:signal transduction histidine kinase